MLLTGLRKTQKADGLITHTSTRYPWRFIVRPGLTMGVSV